MRTEIESQEVCEIYNLDPEVRYTRFRGAKKCSNVPNQVVQKYVRFGEVFSTCPFLLDIMGL